MKRALIVQGGLESHEPAQTAQIMADALRKHDFEIVISDRVDSFADPEYTASFDLLIPHVTAGRAELSQLTGLFKAVETGVGLAGIHGGGTAGFRHLVEFLGIFGGQFVSHPGGGNSTFTVHVTDATHPITHGLSDFEHTSEQYYMLVDPANHVLAEALYPAERSPAGIDVLMPVTWVRHQGEGRVFYCSLGHNVEALTQPEVLEMVTRGLIWAAR